ncbi:unnamed protein product, partial [Mesorhabditis belari]|uniref:G-protein coupled receptors family 1 profile domain-containing protein n=1 Tax=Mesorhabditis belari TaxID=2138241 RepID=A0AAF3FCT5_9BILA
MRKPKVRSDAEEQPRSWCLYLIFPPLFSSIRFFYPFCNAFIALEKLLVIAAPSFHRRLTYVTVHRIYLILTALLAILMTGFIIYWSRVNDVKSSIVCSNSGYPDLVHKSESMVVMVVLSFGFFCYLPVLAQIKKFVDRSRCESSSNNRAYYVKFVSAVKWTSLILLSMLIFNLTPEICNFLQLDIYRGYEFYFYLLFAAKPLFNTFVIGFGNRDVRSRISRLFCAKERRKKSISAWPSAQSALGQERRKSSKGNDPHFVNK